MSRLQQLLLFFLLFAAMQLRAQYEPQFSHYMFNPLEFNPAYAGSRNGADFSLLHRSQYVGLSTRATATQYFGAHLPVDRISSGLGLTVVNDLIGYQRTTAVNVEYAYRKTFTPGTFSIGISAGFIQTGLQGNKLVTPEGDYNNGVNHNDDYVPASLQNGIAPDFSAGIRWGNERYNIGISANHLYSFAKLKTSSGSTRINYARNFAFTGGYRFDVSKKFAITPSALVKPISKNTKPSYP